MRDGQSPGSVRSVPIVPLSRWAATLAVPDHWVCCRAESTRPEQHESSRTAGPSKIHGWKNTRSGGTVSQHCLAFSPTRCLISRHAAVCRMDGLNRRAGVRGWCTQQGGVKVPPAGSIPNFLWAVILLCVQPCIQPCIHRCTCHAFLHHSGNLGKAGSSAYSKWIFRPPAVNVALKLWVDGGHTLS